MKRLILTSLLACSNPTVAVDIPVLADTKLGISLADYRTFLVDQSDNQKNRVIVAGVGVGMTISDMGRSRASRPGAITPNQVLYTINTDGYLRYYNFQGMNSGENRWGRIGTVIGNSWNFQHIFSGGDGVIFTINDNGDLFHYRYLGMTTGENKWAPGTGKRIGNGWNFRNVFSGGDGVIFAINDNGDLFHYRYLGMTTGENKWAPGTGKRIGNGWNFRHVFSGGDGVIFAINDNGDLFHYRYLGMTTGENKWAPGTGKQIGNGWNFPDVLAELRPSTKVALEEPVHNVLPPDHDPGCDAYARRAVDQYQLTLKDPKKCHVDFEKGRWQANHKAHYGWCMTNPGEAALANEEKIRDEHLYRCGAQTRMANPILVPSD